jgi:hypothetical protein
MADRWSSKGRKEEMKIFKIPYRWLPSTIIPNLLSMKDDVVIGIKNIFRWIPVIWFDRDFDWSYLASIMEYKLRRMSSNFNKYGHHVSSKKDAKRMIICAELLKRLISEEYFEKTTSFKQQEKLGDYYQEYLASLLGKHLRSWWN